MENANYAPRPLAASREYPGYQFYARLCLDGHTAYECLRYTALTVQNWLCERIRSAEGRLPEELACPPRSAFMDVRTEDLRSCVLPFAEIISLPKQGVWALMVREPDPDIAARAFVTHAAVRIRDEHEVEFGAYIDVVDRDPALPEAEKAYRPQFVRLLFDTAGMTLRQAGKLAYRKYADIRDRRDVARLKDLADDRANLLPLVVFTQAPVPFDPVKAAADAAKTVNRRAFQAPEEAGTFPAPGGGFSPAYTLPYDAEEFSKHIYGFAQAYVADPKAFRELRAKFNRARLNEGDILIAEPKAFGGGQRVTAYRDCTDAERADVLSRLQEELQRYSKRKPFDFGRVLFLEDARQLTRTLELEAIRASVHKEKSTEMRQMLGQLEQERELSAQQARQIAELRAQMLDEYRRGEESALRHLEALDEEIRSLKADNARLRSYGESMQRAFSEYGAMKEAAARVQSITSMPKTNEDVVKYFALIFADRIAFTERGMKTAAKCDINPDTLWTCLYNAATVLTDMYREGVQGVDERFRDVTGWELGLTEGSQTRKIADMMSLRRDVYEDREISVEPHIKFPRSLRKTGAQYQRLYYAYDAQTGKLIVGYVGYHLENYSSLGFH